MNNTIKGGIIVALLATSFSFSYTYAEPRNDSRHHEADHIRPNNSFQYDIYLPIRSPSYSHRRYQRNYYHWYLQHQPWRAARHYRKQQRRHHHPSHRRHHSSLDW